MKKIITLMFISISLVLFSACGEEEDAAKQKTVQTPVKKKSYINRAKFIQPKSNVLTKEKCKQYLVISKEMMKLDSKLAEELSQTADKEKQIDLVTRLNSGQDELCRRLGFRGIEEYQWVNEALKDSQNEQTAKSAGLSLIPVK